MAGLAACVTTHGGRGSREAAAPEEFDWLDEVTIDEGVPPCTDDDKAVLMRSLRGLTSSDFAVYSSAARSIVALGEPATPYLGYAAGDATRPESLRARVRIVLRAVYAQAEPKTVGAGLTASYPAVRAASAEAAGKRRIVEFASVLVTLLDDADVDVRQESVSALRRISNSFFGYHARASERARAESVTRWRELWPPS